MPVPVHYDDESQPSEGDSTSRAGIQFPKPTFQVPGPMTPLPNPYGGSPVAIARKGKFYSIFASSLHSTELSKTSRLAGRFLHGRVSGMAHRDLLLHTHLLPMRAVATLTPNRGHTMGCPIRIVQLTRVTQGHRAEVSTEEGVWTQTSTVYTKRPRRNGGLG